MNEYCLVFTSVVLSRFVDLFLFHLWTLQQQQQ